ncbi:MAG: M20/M25/M40 family metallo-hydrolase [Phenylobacterium sp.]|uniref:M20/M25/M40 family metallo-hydrolase n=1 Tax=Phenylobacterium sp. TaxID=1871053 RepID=UPI003018357B
MLKRAACLAACALAFTGTAYAAGLSGAERRMVAAVDASQDAQLGLLEQLVGINSGTMNLAGVQAVSRRLEPEFRALGFEVRWSSMAEAGRAGHLIATHTGSGKGRRMLLIGHLDTVFEPDSPFKGYVRSGNTVTGPGVNDMKGGIVIMLGALQAMKAAGTLKDADITVVLTGDEERMGKPTEIARRDLVEAARRSDLALDFEGLATENGADMGSIARRSSSTWTLKVKAKPGHSSGIFSGAAGYGAIFELSRILDAFRKDLREPNATYNVGLVLGGANADLNTTATGGKASGKSNIIAAEALAIGDLRTLSNAQTESLKAKMASIVQTSLPGTRASLEFTEGYPAMPPTEGSRRILAQLNGVNRDLGYPEMVELDPLKRGAGDIAFVSGIVDGLVGLGAGGEGAHAPGETLDIPAMRRQTRRAALLMSRLARPGN